MQFVTNAEACQILADGGFIIYPTETFLALGCNPQCQTALAALYKIKRRSSQKPLPLIAASLAAAGTWANLGDCPAELLERFWPGPLSVLLPAKNNLAACLLNQEHKLAARVSASAVATALASAIGGRITATSANFADEAPCHTSAGLSGDFIEACAGSGLPWGIVNAGNNCHYNAPSTLVEPMREQAGWALKIIREGAIARTTLAGAGWRLR